MLKAQEFSIQFGFECEDLRWFTLLIAGRQVKLSKEIIVRQKLSVRIQFSDYAILGRFFQKVVVR